MLSKIWIWDPGSEIRDPEKTYPDPGVKKAPDPGSGSATLIQIVHFLKKIIECGTISPAIKLFRHKTVKNQGFFYFFLLDDGRTQSRLQYTLLRIWSRRAIKFKDPDPEHR
jgi:hypothetical protein